jgi:hypothetical protein
VRSAGGHRSPSRPPGGSGYGTARDRGTRWAKVAVAKHPWACIRRTCRRVRPATATEICASRSDERRDLTRTCRRAHVRLLRTPRTAQKAYQGGSRLGAPAHRMYCDVTIGSGTTCAPGALARHHSLSLSLPGNKRPRGRCRPVIPHGCCPGRALLQATGHRESRNTPREGMPGSRFDKKGSKGGQRAEDPWPPVLWDCSRVLPPTACRRGRKSMCVRAIKADVRCDCSS